MPRPTHSVPTCRRRAAARHAPFRVRQAVKIAVAADAANLRGDQVKFGAVEQRLTDILSGVCPLSQIPDTVGGGSTHLGCLLASSRARRRARGCRAAG